jgi:hypothetical protein
MDVKPLIDTILRACDAEHMLPPLKTRLVKLLYLVELEYYRRTGKRLTELDWKFHHYGPYAFALQDSLGDPDEERLALMLMQAPPPLEHDLRACVTDVVHQWGDADLNDLLDYAYFETEPMQAAKRGESLSFAGVASLAQTRKDNIRIDLDAKKLDQLRKALVARAAEYGQLRVANEISNDLIENLREWDIDHTLRLKPGSSCKIDPKSLI